MSHLAVTLPDTTPLYTSILPQTVSFLVNRRIVLPGMYPENVGVLQQAYTVYLIYLVDNVDIVDVVSLLEIYQSVVFLNPSSKDVLALKPNCFPAFEVSSILLG